MPPSSTTVTAAPFAPLPPLPRPPPKPPVPVSIADRCHGGFPPVACFRGYRLFHRKRVELAVSGARENLIDATVKGKRVQRVRLHLDAGELASACSCCPRLLGPATCKHVWATLLEVDHRGLLVALRNTARSLALGVIDAPLRPRRPKVVAKPAAPCEKSKTSSPRPKRTGRKPGEA